MEVILCLSALNTALMVQESMLPSSCMYQPRLKALAQLQLVQEAPWHLLGLATWRMITTGIVFLLVFKVYFIISFIEIMTKSENLCIYSFFSTRL